MKHQTYDEGNSIDVLKTSASLTDLSKFTEYKIQVAAFTVKGHGPRTQEIVLRTSEDGKEIYRNKEMREKRPAATG